MINNDMFALQIVLRSQVFEDLQSLRGTSINRLRPQKAITALVQQALILGMRDFRPI